MTYETEQGRITIPDELIVETFPDTDRYACRFTIRSESRDANYMVSLDKIGRHWTCSCRGNIRHGQCKHLKSMNLLTRHDKEQGAKSVWSDEYKPYGSNKAAPKGTWSQGNAVKITPPDPSYKPSREPVVVGRSRRKFSFEED